MTVTHLVSSAALIFYLRSKRSLTTLQKSLQVSNMKTFMLRLNSYLIHTPSMPTASETLKYHCMKQGPIEIVYGFHSDSRYYLMAMDARLKVDPGNKGDESFADLCRSVDTLGRGAYMKASTAGMRTQITKEAMKDLWRLYRVPSCECCTAVLEQDLNASSNENRLSALQELKQSLKECEKLLAKVLEARKRAHEKLKAHGMDEVAVEASNAWKVAFAKLLEYQKGMRDLMEAHGEMRKVLGEDSWSTFENTLA